MGFQIPERLQGGGQPPAAVGVTQIQPLTQLSGQSGTGGHRLGLQQFADQSGVRRLRQYLLN